MKPADPQLNASMPTAVPPPVPVPSAVLRWRRAIMVIALLMVGGIVSWTVRSSEPNGQLFYPRCQFHALTGLQCPGCGATRAVHHLLHGEVLAAIRSNAPLVLFFVPVLGLWGWKGLLGQRVEHRFTGRWAVGILILLLAFFVVRNVPGPTHAWLNPPPPAASQ
jgi:hypothetical protein